MDVKWICITEKQADLIMRHLCPVDIVDLDERVEVYEMRRMLALSLGEAEKIRVEQQRRKLLKAQEDI